MLSSGDLSRRDVLSALTGAAAVPLMPDFREAVHAAGVSPSDLVIKDVKVYVVEPGADASANGIEHQLAAIVTNSGIEGNYTLAKRYPHPTLVFYWAQ